jgi:hypothetical protein
VDSAAAPTISIGDDIFLSRLQFTEFKVSQMHTHQLSLDKFYIHKHFQLLSTIITFVITMPAHAEKLLPTLASSIYDL